MIVKQKDMRLESRAAWRDGDGVVECRHLSPKNPDKWRIAAVMEFDPGDSIGEHAHNNETELYYVLEGTGTVWDNGEAVEVTAGDAIFTGNGSSHSIKNTGDGMLRVLALVIQQ